MTLAWTKDYHRTSRIDKSKDHLVTKAYPFCDCDGGITVAGEYKKKLVRVKGEDKDQCIHCGRYVFWIKLPHDWKPEYGLTYEHPRLKEEPVVNPYKKKYMEEYRKKLFKNAI